MVQGFGSISITQFPAKSFLLLVYHSSQLSHTWSDFSQSLRVMISETRILFHFIPVFLSSALMKQLTCSVGIISLIRIFGLDI